MRLLFFLLVLMFASAPFFMAQAAEPEALKCHGSTALDEDEMPFATADDSQSMVYERIGNVIKVSVAGQDAQYKDGDKFAVEQSGSLAAVRERKTGIVVLSLEEIPLMEGQKRWGAKAKYVVRGIDPRSGQAFAKPVQVLCERNI